ncbi:MAG: ATP-dependent DNA helicase [Deltaproteobacteria bacterium]|nr:MAG: ATP-dependent DNA helicase [Deltaproteobacteria bacterium]
MDNKNFNRPESFKNKKQKRYNKNKKYHNGKKRTGTKLKAGSDKKLREVFNRIGIPENNNFKADDFQQEAIDLVPHKDCIVTAPTGAGKTWIAEVAMEKIFKAGGKSWYASPLKALTNTLFTIFANKFGAENVGILTGDRKELPDAPIVIGTTEILRNHLYDAMHEGKDIDTDYVIMDEAHYLGDEDRGVVWEEVLIYLPPRIPVLLLSATIENASEISGWMESIRKKKCSIIKAEKRPVDLYPLFLHPSGTIFPFFEPLNDKNKTPSKKLYKKVQKFISNNKKHSLSRPGGLPPMGHIIKIMEKYKLLPGIFFLKSRADCDFAVELCEKNGLRINEKKRRQIILKLEELQEKHPHIKNHPQIKFVISSGVAAHHSGHLPPWKEAVEELMTHGLLNAVFATTTVAAGVNFPARTVVLSNSDKFNGVEFLPLTPTELHQMTGRAGRRGMDKIGFALILPGKFMKVRQLAKIFAKTADPVTSKIKIDFSMVLNLLLSHTPRQIETLIEKSLASYQIHESGELKKDFRRKLSFLSHCGYIDEKDSLTFDGTWASRLRIDYPLVVAEGFRTEIFPDSPVLLAAIISCFVTDREYKDELLSHRSIPKNLKKEYIKIKKNLGPFFELLKSNKFDAPVLYLTPAVLTYHWAMGVPWEKVADLTEIAEGDMVRLFLRTADNLRHIRNLTEVFPEESSAASEAIDLILREPVITN